ncbi:helix-turn-helix domain-containing protein [Candidatus Proelusimicrobium volucris]|uniref:helix-turn-helix domain-containing protein n=1 Tax=Candidatus Proelusimicrobium volucris TaxID=3416225 RepID=UPI003D126114
MNKLNKALRLIRVFNDMSLSELAKEMKVSIGYLSEIESGKKNPSLDIIRKYATVFHTTESAILFFSENIQIDSKTKTALRNNILKFLEALDHLKKSK